MRSISREKAILLREEGLSYTEIQQRIKVSKSSLSLWLRDVVLPNDLKARINNLRLAGIQKGISTRVASAESKRVKLLDNSRSEISTISNRELWLIGISLYWAEGTKQRINSPSQRVAFNNSDPDMLRIFLMWLFKCAKVVYDDILFEIYVHETMIDQKQQIIKFWSNTLGVPEEKFDRIYIKTNIVRKKRFSKEYHGLVRVVVKKSTNLNRKILGWQQGIINSCRVV